jgi:hypothetical protein
LLLRRDGSHARVFGSSLLATGCTPAECANFQNLLTSSAGPRFLDAERIDAEGLDAEGLDYRLHAASPAVDATTAIEGDDRDLDGLPRDVAINPHRVTLGARDLGAYERQGLEPLVPNGDFLVGVSPWTPLGVATAEVVDVGASGAPGGAVLVSDTDNRGAEVAALRLCVPLPLPGEYRLTGLAAGQGFLAVHRDRVRIRWRRYASSASSPCTGTPIQTGELVFPNRQTLSPPLTDARIDVPTAAFDERAAIEIELVATEGNTIAVNDPTGGVFDAIRLVPPRP